MELSYFNDRDLLQLRIQECQGTLIGGMVVAGSLGLNPEEYGYRMMILQDIRWEIIAGNLDKIAQIFNKHYQITYGFGSQLEVTRENNTLQFKMPSITKAVAGQLSHWSAEAKAFEAMQSGIWRAVETHAHVAVILEFNSDQHIVTVQCR